MSEQDEQPDPRTLSPMATTRLQAAVALVQRCGFADVQVAEHSPGQIIVRVEGVPDEAFVNLYVVQADRGDQTMPDAARSGPEPMTLPEAQRSADLMRSVDWTQEPRLRMCSDECRSSTRPMSECRCPAGARCLHGIRARPIGDAAGVDGG